MKAAILQALRETNGYVSGQELCERFGVSRTAVWKAINMLKERGYEIESVTNKGYRIVSEPDIMDADELRSIWSAKWMGQEIKYYDSVDSTNVRAKLLAEEGYPSGTLIVANEQTAGKGRRGRNWDSKKDTGIFMTMMLKPDINPSRASMLTLIAALAQAKALRDITGEDVRIKWPNDVVLNGKKIVGILTEMSAQFDYINHIVIGNGINVNTTSFPEELQNMATSLFLETGKKFKRAEIIAKTWEYFEQFYKIFLETEDLSALMKEYNALLVNMHKGVKVLDPKEPFEGKAMGITKNGELIVDTWECRKLVSSGEVSVRGIYGYV